MGNDNVVSLAAPADRFPTHSRTFFAPARGG